MSETEIDAKKVKIEEEENQLQRVVRIRVERIISSQNGSPAGRHSSSSSSSSTDSDDNPDSRDSNTKKKQNDLPAPRRRGRAPTDRPPAQRGRRRSRVIDESSCHGLRQVTFQVMRKLETKQFKTYEQVAKELAQEFVYGENGSHQLRDEKNMRRRAYDVMNVLAAVGHLQKRGKQLTYLGKHTNTRLFEMQMERSQRLARLKIKKAELQSMRDQKAALELLIARNRSLPSPQPGETIQIPFDLLVCDKTTDIDCTRSDDKTKYSFTFDQPFELLSSLHVIRRMNIDLPVISPPPPRKQQAHTDACIYYYLANTPPVSPSLNQVGQSQPELPVVKNEQFTQDEDYGDLPVLPAEDVIDFLSERDPSFDLDAQTPYSSHDIDYGYKSSMMSYEPVSSGLESTSCVVAPAYESYDSNFLFELALAMNDDHN